VRPGGPPPPWRARWWARAADTICGDAVGLYARHIFPRVMDWTLRRPRFQRERQEALAAVGGEVLEIGFGTGLNIRHYPPGVTRLTAIDVADLLPARTGQRIS